MRGPLLGCIADDFTGASDLANNLSRAGMRVLLTVGVPAGEEVLDVDAVVVALKTRTMESTAAVAFSRAACRALRSHGVRTLYFKICSTFDSTAEGNIGPVLETLMDETGTKFSLVVPAFPEAGRTVHNGTLFVHGVPLAESSMRNHPLTPMTNSDLISLLGAQLRRIAPHSVGRLEHAVVARSAECVRQRMLELQDQGCRIAIADTGSMDDLDRLAEALADTRFVTASSGLGVSLPRQWGFHHSSKAQLLPPAQGPSVILSGSCSETTQAQLQHLLLTDAPGLLLDLSQLQSDPESLVQQSVAWVKRQWLAHPTQPVILYTSPIAGCTGNTTALLVGSMVEKAFASLALALVQAGAGVLIVAGGETSGVCVQALGISALRIGPQIDPGVPWCFAERNLARAGGLHLALKSGNFGAVNFFTKALALLSPDHEPTVAP